MNETNKSTHADEIFALQLSAIQQRTDRTFAVLFAVQWAFAIICAVLLSQCTWAAGRSYLHFHVWSAVILGGLLSAGPIFLAWIRPGCVSTRMTIAATQMLYSALLIHLTGGRIETHFHVFGSLAILAFYRDWRVFVPATLVIVVDGLVRGMFWPESVFGVLAPAPWRAAERVRPSGP